MEAILFLLLIHSMLSAPHLVAYLDKIQATETKAGQEEVDTLSTEGVPYSVDGELIKYLKVL